MPLTTFQSTIALLLAPNRDPSSYLAGGAALHIEPNSMRYSNDLDHFNDSEERVAVAFQEDMASLAAAGYTVSVLMNQRGFVRAVVKKQNNATKVEWAHDTAWRFLPPVQNPLSGYQLHPMDLAINKVLALVGRDEARDFLDTLHVHDTILPLGALVWAAAGKDPGFTPLLLLSLLRRRGRYRQEDFGRLMLREPIDLPALKVKWLTALADAEVFIQSRPPEELGCLYYSLTLERFVGSFTADEGAVKPHFGRPGGVLPRFVDDAL